MKKLYVLISLLLLGCYVTAQTYKYPATKTVEVSDTYFGKELKDPYRWLEEIKNDEVVKWFHDEADFTNSVLNNIPGKQTLFDELKKLSKVKSASYRVLDVIGEVSFFSKRLPGEQTSKFYRRFGDNGKDELLFDPENFVKDKIFDYSMDVNKTGTHILLNLTEKGKELGDIYFMDLKTKMILPDTIRNSSGYFLDSDTNIAVYLKNKTGDIHDPEVNLDMKTMLHTIGDNVENDKVVASRETHPELHFTRSDVSYVDTFAKSHFMILQKIDVDASVELFYAPLAELESDSLKWNPLCDKSEEIAQSMSFGGSPFVVRENLMYANTTKGTDLGKVIMINLESPDFSHPKVIYESMDNWKVESIGESKDYMLIALSKNNVEYKNLKYNFSTGNLSEAIIPLKGTVVLFPMNSFSNEGLILNTSWTEPMNYYKYDLLSDEFSKSPFYVNTPYPGIADLSVEEVEVASHDGTMIPLSIVYDKTKLKKDGTNIVLLSGYGSYGISTPPNFSYYDIPLFERGVVLAIAHVRGGGEKGKMWHKAGQKVTKPNTWKDFNACAEYLIDNHYTSPEHLACEGGSAGGILIGRAITERPDLYKAAVPMVGSLNPVRMELTTNGPLNIPEFGTMTDSIESRALIEMDAMHNIKPGTHYPAQLITTGFNDPRVTSWIPAKYAATMQKLNEGDAPVLLHVDFDSGHFGGSTIDESFKKQSDIMAFILWQCGDPAFQMTKSSK